jgi:hypothetical protein
MADTKIEDLTAGTTANATDRIPVTRDPTGTPVNRYVTPAYIKDYILGLANTWSLSQTFSAAALFADGTSGAPGIAFAGSTGVGFFRSGSSICVFGDICRITQYGMNFGGSYTLTWYTGGAYAAISSQLDFEATGILGIVNGANAQTLRIYSTFTDSSNYQRLKLGWNTTTAVVHNEGAGTGADGSVAFNDAALATNATKGFVMIPSCAGAPSGVPADIPTGQIPLVFDSTNNKLYAYDGGWLSTAALT